MIWRVPWKWQIRFESIKMLLWCTTINTEFSACFGTSGLTSPVLPHSWCIHCMAPLTFYLKQSRASSLRICGAECPCLCLEEPCVWALPKAGCKEPHTMVCRDQCTLYQEIKQTLWKGGMCFYAKWCPVPYIQTPVNVFINSEGSSVSLPFPG